MEERTVDDKSSRTPSRLWYCVERLRTGSVLLWVLCLTSWIVLCMYRYRLVHVEDRVSALEARFDLLGMGQNPSSAMDHHHAYIKSVIRQVRFPPRIFFIPCVLILTNCEPIPVRKILP
ncbi:hypothetical protein AVEN_147176-1 [Araneus ventricosus]|uniref:Uncharacterized protein n=1 Tax=Araneus ventricosus TaxID=182803 RepID=A0A4Y2M9D8_ARAVE|nr:hypothetical protein AVEN_147176-1 [Araneus ventricosus]